jgi:hypothetical protein
MNIKLIIFEIKKYLNLIIKNESFLYIFINKINVYFLFLKEYYLIQHQI